MQYVVYAFELVQFFHCDYVLGFFDDADGRRRTGFAYFAGIVLGKIAAHAAIFYFLLTINDRVGKRFCVGVGHAYDFIGVTLSRLFAYAR